jgi:la-related protein 1
MQPSTRLANGTPPSFWVKEGDIPTEPLDDDTSAERYGTFRPKALAERQSAAQGESPKEMNILYNFWSHFLVDKFNSRMYQEFRSVALEDQSARGSNSGLLALIQFYDATLASPRVVSSEIAQDFVDIVNMESKDENRPAFHKLRVIWRNGAFNLKSRRIIDKILDAELKAELES